MLILTLSILFFTKFFFLKFSTETQYSYTAKLAMIMLKINNIAVVSYCSIRTKKLNEKSTFYLFYKEKYIQAKFIYFENYYNYLPASTQTGLVVAFLSLQLEDLIWISEISLPSTDFPIDLTVILGSWVLANSLM